MATWEQTQTKIKAGWVCQRSSWDPCKLIRSWKESDADYFVNEFQNEEAIIQECNKPCDCAIGIWIPEGDDKTAEDWIVLYNHKPLKSD